MKEEPRIADCSFWAGFASSDSISPHAKISFSPCNGCGFVTKILPLSVAHI